MLLRRPPVVLLDDSRANTGRLFHNPVEIIEIRNFDEVPDALIRLDAHLAAGRWAAGWLAYEVGLALEPAFEPSSQDLPKEPLIWLMICEAAMVQTVPDVTAFLQEAQGGTTRPGQLILQKALDLQDWYYPVARQLKDAIAAGDIYQANLTFQQPITLKGDVLAAYMRIRRAQPVPYGAYIHTGDWQILSFSPELFVRSNGQHIDAKPMKGTAARSPLVAEDHSIAQDLATDPKQRAENLMIVDLMRNDLSRITAPGSVSVPSLFEVETYRSVHQMTSTVRAQRIPDVPASALLRAIFPCGSVTGAPKIKAMEHLRAQERAPRGIYTGSIGWFGPGNQAVLNVAIRTVVVESDGKGHIGLGSGLVADSDIAAEWAECQTKSRFLRLDDPGDFALIETIGVRGGQPVCPLGFHKARMAASAHWFDRRFDEEAWRDLTDALIASVQDRPDRFKLRLLLDARGRLTGTIAAVAEKQAPIALSLAKESVDARDPFLYHKTTHRRIYEQALRQKSEKVDDIVLHNSDGEITECCTGSIFFERNGHLCTPPVTSGSLPGVLRQTLLDQGKVSEVPLSTVTLAGIVKLWWGNAVHGLHPARLLSRAE